MKWYVLHTRHNHERAVYGRLLGKVFEPYLPLLRVARRLRRMSRPAHIPLFQHYVFVRCNLDMYSHLELVMTPGVIRLVHDGHGLPLVVPEEEIQTIRQICSADVTLEGFANQLQGERMRVTRGALRGITGIVPEGCPGTLVIPIHTLRKGVAVRIGRLAVIPCSDLSQSPVTGSYSNA